MRTVENDIPEIFLELAREAFALGLAEVRIGFWYMGSDFISPIEWALWLTKRESASEARETIVATMQRDEDKPTAYIPEPGGNPWDAAHWGPDEIRSWMKEPLEAEGEYAIEWTPTEDPAVQEKFLAQWPLFEEGVRSGWSMERKISWSELNTMRRTMEKLDGEFDATELPTLGLSWDITNSFYNTEDHADNRDTGAPISAGGWSLLFDGEEEKFYRHGDGDPRPIPLSRVEVEELLNTNHPWFVRVAVNDEEQEDWLHFPEALQDSEHTIQSLEH